METATIDPDAPVPIRAARGARRSSPLDYATVVVPLDGSPAAERALPVARWLARRLDAQLHAVIADVPPTEAEWYRRYADELEGRHPGLTVGRTGDPDVVKIVGDVAARLGPALVCLATHGWSGGGPHVGPTYAALAAASPGPLVAVGEQARPGVDDAAARIVACVDGTAAAEAVLPAAARWARGLGAALSIVTVAQPAGRPLVPGSRQWPAHGPADPDAYLDRLVDRPEVAGLDVDGTVLWSGVRPHVALAEHLRDHPATLVAVAAHPRTGPARLVAGGGEAARIIETSPVPVLVQPVG
ncbi:MAG TPA: universal stress protein [Acidimicrobiales bacterium]